MTGDLNQTMDRVAAQRERKRLPILCLDFDGVLHGYQSGWQGAAIIPDLPVPGAVEFLHGAVERFRVAVYSSRSNQPGGIDAMRGWLTMHVMATIEDRCEAAHVLGLIEWPTEKPPALVTLDDRAITFMGAWPSLDDIAAFKPWNKRPPDEALAEAERVAKAMEDGGWWSPCTGCHETVDGHETGHYPYSSVYRCHVGAGCCECGGIGVVWQRFTETDAVALEAAMVDEGEQAPELIRHVKSGGVYEVLFRGAQIQTDTPLADYAKVDGYRNVETGAVWVRPGAEMNDGRFVPVEPAEMPAALATREAARG